MRGFAGVYYSRNAAVAHNKNSVSNAKKLGHLRGNKNDALSLLGDIDDQGLNFVFCPDVDSLGRLIEHENV